jgi:DNA-binding response OmpR family regulator
MQRHHILLVDDDPDILTVTGWALEDRGYHVTRALCGEAAIELLNSRPFDLIITDLDLGKTSGLVLLRRTKETQPGTPVMIYTGNSDVTCAIDALRLGADDYILKPPDLTDFMNRIGACLQKAEVRSKPLPPQADSPLLNAYVLHKVKLMAEDFRASLSSIRSTLTLLNRGFFGSMEERAAEKLRELLARVARLSGTAEDCLGQGLSVDEDMEMEQEVLDLKKDIINPVLEELSTEIQDRHVLVENRVGAHSINGIRVKASKIWLKGALRHLLQNAMNYGDKRCTIVFGFQNDGSRVKLNVFNSGKPIPKEYRDQLFSKCIRIENGIGKDVQGPGLGLYLTRKMLQRQGGDICYEAQDNGSNFVITLPGGQQEWPKAKGNDPQREDSAIPASRRLPTMARM